MMYSSIINQSNQLLGASLIRKSTRLRQCGGITNRFEIRQSCIQNNKKPSANNNTINSIYLRRKFGSTTEQQAEKITLTESQAAALAQRRAYEYYRIKSGAPKNAKGGSNNQSNESIHDRNVKIASYAAAAVVGALGATYAAVPLYKIFCQTTGFGGTTQRVNLSDWAESQEAREESGRGKVSQALWDKLIAMSNVPREMLPGSAPGSSSHGRGARTWTPPKVGLYFTKIQCFCFEEQRLLPGETVDMPVFFFIDPEIMDDPQLKHVNNVTLSYTFFQTDMDDEDDDDGDDEDEEA